MERQPVESSQIASVGFASTHYEEDFLDGVKRHFGVLEIEFKGGSIYKYDSVPEEIFRGMMTAESVGKYFGANIKAFPEKYPFTKLRGTDREEAKKAHEDDAAANE